MIKIYPSLISANLLNLGDVIRTLEPYCSGFHLDIMDNKFVPNLTFGFDFINAIANFTKKPLQIHLMVEYPEKYINNLNLRKNDLVSIHYESPSISIINVLQNIKKRGLIPSIAIDPITPIEALISLPAVFEHVLLMSVKPGFSGQRFIPNTFNKLQALINFRQAYNLNFKIEIDGGVNKFNLQTLIELDADEVAIASAIFNNENIIESIKTLIDK